MIKLNIYFPKIALHNGVEFWSEIALDFYCAMTSRIFLVLTMKFEKKIVKPNGNILKRFQERVSPTFALKNKVAQRFNKSYPYCIYFSRQFQKVKGGKKRFWTYRKSSSMSSTLASKLLEVFSFNSNSRIRLVIIIVLRVIGFPGRCIRNIQGSHWRNSVRTCSSVHTQNFIRSSVDPTDSYAMYYIVCTCYFPSSLKKIS